MTLYLVAGTCKRTARVVWFGKDGQWAYDRPQGLCGWSQKEDAERGKLIVESDMAAVVAAVFGSGYRGEIPSVRNVRVMGFARKSEPPPVVVRKSLWLIMVTSPTGAIAWIGNEECPALEPLGLKGFTSAAEAEIVRSVLERGGSGSTFVVKELARKGGA